MYTTNWDTKNPSTKALFRLDPTKEEQCHASKTWLRNALGTILCPKCKKIGCDWYPQPIDVIVTPAPKKAAYVHLWWTGVKVFRRDVIQALQPLMKNFVIGSCTDEDTETTVENYVTCYARDRLVLIGDEYSRYFECELCEARWLQPPRSRPMLHMTVEQLPPSEQHVYQAWGCGLYIDSVAAKALRTLQIKGIRLVQVAEILLGH